MAFYNNIAIIIISSGFFSYTDSLLCYQCGDSGPDAPCLINTAEMLTEHVKWNKSTVDSHTGNEYKYMKNCTTPNYNACVIERIEEIGHLHSIIRDCSNSHHYSIPDTPQFDTLIASRNHTMCVYKPLMKMMVCVTLCNTDFCNGPQIVSNKSSCTKSWTVLIGILVTIVSFVNS